MSCQTSINRLFNVAGSALLILYFCLAAPRPAGAQLQSPQVRVQDSASVARAAQMAKTVTIYRDKYGVPHVYGPTDAACMFGFTYAQCEDYFWQVEDGYLRALGLAAQVHGESELPNDIINRGLDICGLAQQEFANATAQTREFNQAVTDALNYFLATHPEVQPRAMHKFEPWHPLALGRFLLYQSFIYQKSGLQAREVLTAVQEIDGAEKKAVSLLPATRQRLDELAEMEADYRSLTQHVGSNMWAVRPEKSTSGKALLFINPHQPFFGPGQWYEGHVVSGEGWNLSGACLFGSPFPTIGYNEHLGWSHTVNQPNIANTYTIHFDHADDPLKYRYGNEHRQATQEKVAINVKTDDGQVTRQFLITKTHHGPIVAKRGEKLLAVKFAKLDSGGALEQWYHMGKAKTVAEFKKAMEPCNIPMFNAVAADFQGNIFYVYGGAIPRRSLKFDWSAPVDGSDPESEWQGFHAFEELPQVENPACGFVQNCNQSPWTTTNLGKELSVGQVDENPKSNEFPKYMVTEKERDNGRARISRRILASNAQFSYEDWSKYAFDTTIIEAETRIPELVDEWQKLLAKEPERGEKLREVVEALRDWNGISTIESVPMTLTMLTFERLMQMLPKGDILNSPRVRALEATLADLEKNFGTWKVAWGEINRLQRIHGSQIDMTGQGQFSDSEHSLPVAGAPGPLGVVFNFYALPQKDQKRRYGVAGHSFVGVVEFAEAVRAKTVLQFGQSGDPKSPHWFDQAELYASGQFKPSWYVKNDVEANSQPGYHPGQRR
ncbi:MAG: penicillin acylase family protein [Pirellulaceae bacterium]|nr:penicillin acylase family protein [Pirellulaceae bacterium]